MFRYRQQNSNRKSAVLKLLAGLIITGTVLAVVSGYIWYDVNTDPAAGSNGQTQQIIVEVGESEYTIANELKSKGLIKSSLAYRISARISGLQGNMVAGEYEVSASMSTQMIQRLFTEGATLTEPVTILPGQRLDQIAETFSAAGYNQAEIDQALEPANFAGHPALVYKPPSASLEGYLYPETFLKTTATPLTDIVELSLDETALMFTAERIAGLSEQGLSVHDAIIIASIIEEEVSNDADKALVAQVFLKRLAEGISLGSDPTAFYATALAGVPDSVFYDSPYNTRIYAGLPPGPISNVTISSLDALINPADTDYLYFVAGDDGTTYFSTTLAEHERKTELYCTILCR